MAEVTGQIGQEYVELDNAATEVTLQEVRDAIVAMGKKLGVKDVDFRKELNRLTAGMTKINKEELAQRRLAREIVATNQRKENQLQKSKEDHQEKTKKYDETRNAIWSKTTNILTSSVKEIASTINTIAGMGDSLSSFTSLLSKIPIIGGTLDATLTPVAANAERLQASFVQATSAGANFGGSITQMINTATGAGLTFDQFSNIVSKNSEGLSLFAAGTAEGAIRLGRLSKEMKTQITQSGLAELGYTTETANDAMAKYIGMLSRSGATRHMSDQQIVASSTAYLKNLDAVSKLTGKQKDALQAEQEARQNDSRLRAMLAGKDVETATNIQAFIDSFDSPEAQEAVKTLLTKHAAVGDAAAAFVNTFGSEITDKIIAAGYDIENGGKFTNEKFVKLGVDSYAAAEQAMKNNPALDTMATYLEDKYGGVAVGLMNMAEKNAQGAEEIFKKLLEDLNKPPKAPKTTTDPLAADIAGLKQHTSELSNQASILLSKFIPDLKKGLDLAYTGLENTMNLMSGNIGAVSAIVKGTLVAQLALAANSALNFAKKLLPTGGAASSAAGTAGGAAAGTAGGAVAKWGTRIIKSAKGGLIGAVADVGLGLLADVLGKDTFAGALADTAASTAGWAGTGAMIGTMIAPGIGTAIGAGLGGLTGAIKGVITNREVLFTELDNAIEGAGMMMSDAWKSMKEGASELGNLAKEGWAEYSTAFSQGWDYLTDEAAAEWESTKAAGTTAWNNISTAVFEGWAQYKQDFSEGWNFLKENAAEGVDKLSSIASTGWDMYKGLWSNGWDIISAGTEGGLEGLTAKVSEKMETLSKFASDTWDSFKDTTLGEAVSGLLGSLADKISGIKSWFLDGFNKLKDTDLGQTVSDAANSVKEATSGFFSNISSFFSNGSDEAATQSEKVAKQLEDQVNKSSKLSDIDTNTDKAKTKPNISPQPSLDQLPKVPEPKELITAKVEEIPPPKKSLETLPTVAETKTVEKPTITKKDFDQFKDDYKQTRNRLAEEAFNKQAEEAFARFNEVMPDSKKVVIPDAKQELPQKPESTPVAKSTDDLKTLKDLSYKSVLTDYNNTQARIAEANANAVEARFKDMEDMFSFSAGTPKDTYTNNKDLSGQASNILGNINDTDATTEKTKLDLLKKQNEQLSEATDNSKPKKYNQDNMFQDPTFSSTDQLNSTLDRLGMMMGQLVEINRRQLSVQRGLSNDGFA